MKKFEAKTTLLLTLPAIAIVGLGAFARLYASNQKYQPPFVIVEDEFTRDNGDGFWGFDHSVTVRFRRKPWSQELFSPEKSAWLQIIDETVTSVKTNRKFSPMSTLSASPSTYKEDMRKSTQKYYAGYDEDYLDKIHEPLLFETTISWTEGWGSTVHSITLRHLFSPEQRLKVKTLKWNPKTKKSEVQ